MVNQQEKTDAEWVKEHILISEGVFDKDEWEKFSA